MFIRHEWFEKNAIFLLVGTLVTIAIGGIVEIVPLFTIETTVEHVKGMRPYSPLELRGRDIYVREGCYLCHSQQIRTLRDEVERYGHYSIAAESMYDHPFQWGSKRIGPDLARVGGKYSSDWHYAHLNNAQEMVPESLMPHYAFLAETPLETDDVQAADAHIADGRRAVHRRADHQCQGRSAGAGRPERGRREADGALSEGGGRCRVTAHQVTEADALVAYLQMLGTLVNFADTNTERLQQ